MKALGALTSLAMLCTAQNAHALCEYEGELYPKTIIEREFEDSTWVVRAKVLSAEDHFSEGEEPWTLYRLEVLRAYKGRPARQLRFFTLRNSGGFYMDRGSAHDVGGDYLLFLNPLPVWPGAPSAAEGTVFVNYSCGSSGSWAEVSASARRQLTVLEGRQ